jgi:hypothetical protein
MRFRRCVAAILFLIGTAAIVLLDMGGARLFGNDAFANVVSFTIKPSPQQNFPTSRPPASENVLCSAGGATTQTPYAPFQPPLTSCRYEASSLVVSRPRPAVRWPSGPGPARDCLAQSLK